MRRWMGWPIVNDALGRRRMGTSAVTGRAARRGRRTPVPRGTDRPWGEVGADRVDDELDALDRGLAVPACPNGAFCDDATLGRLDEIDAVVVELAPRPTPHETTGRAQVQFDAPVVVALAEVERPPVDRSFPLLRCPTAVARDDHLRMIIQPCVEFSLTGGIGRCERASLRRRPVRLHVGAPRLPASLALLRRLRARTSEAVVVEVAVWQARVAGARAGTLSASSRRHTVSASSTIAARSPASMTPSQPMSTAAR